ELVEILAGLISSLAASGGEIEAIGVAVPGIVRHGVIEDSPNLPQIKGMRLEHDLSRELVKRGVTAPVHAANDADAIAAGVAATRGQLDKLVRVWTIGNGIGYGRWPYVEGVWKAATSSSAWTPKSAIAAAAASGTSKAYSATAPCACAFSTWSPKKCSLMPGNGIAAVASLSSSGIALLPPPPPPSFIFPARAVSSSPAI